MSPRWSSLAAKQKDVGDARKPDKRCDASHLRDTVFLPGRQVGLDVGIVGDGRALTTRHCAGALDEPPLAHDG